MQDKQKVMLRFTYRLDRTSMLIASFFFQPHLIGFFSFSEVLISSIAASMLTSVVVHQTMLENCQHFFTGGRLVRNTEVQPQAHTLKPVTMDFANPSRWQRYYTIGWQTLIEVGTNCQNSYALGTLFWENFLSHLCHEQHIWCLSIFKDMNEDSLSLS